MTLTIRRSLLEPSTEPVLETSVGWLDGALFGDIAIGLCVLAVAFLGMLMLAGRLPLRSGMRVVLGCFVLLGAPTIAAAFVSSGSNINELEPASLVTQLENMPPREELPPANYDPYAGASLRRD